VRLGQLGEIAQDDVRVVGTRARGDLLDQRSDVRGFQRIEDQHDGVRLSGQARFCHRAVTSFTHQTRAVSGTHRIRRGLGDEFRPTGRSSISQPLRPVHAT